MSKIFYSDIYTGHIFQNFYDTIVSDGGDGAGLLVCRNHIEASQFFLEWYEKTYKRKFPLGTVYEKDEYDDIINYHDSNENFMFSNKVVDLGHRDITHIVSTDSNSGWNQNMVLFGIDK